MGFSKESQLAKHTQKVHGIAINFTCTKCEHIFPSYIAYQRHTSKNSCTVSNIDPHDNTDYQMSDIDYEINNAVTTELMDEFEKETPRNIKFFESSCRTYLTIRKVNHPINEYINPSKSKLTGTGLIRNKF